jgi:CubicO group peptidase (beta-lactamase class C family)
MPQTPTTGNAWAPLAEAVDKLVGDFIALHGLPGMTVAVSKKGRLLLSKGYGHALVDGNRRLPMSPHSRTLFGSCTKCLITGPSAYQLMKAKAIDPKTTRLYGPQGFFKGAFDDDIDAGIKAFADNSKPWKAWYGLITLQHLLDHKAGFARSSPDAEDVAQHFGIPKERVTLAQEHAYFLRTRALRYEPGKPPPDLDPSSYSNHGFGLWALVIELMSGKPYANYVRGHYLRPLGLHNAVRWQRVHVDSCDAHAHQPINGQPEPLPFADSTLGLGLAAGGWMSSAQSAVALMDALNERYTAAELDSMGWGNRGRDKLVHSGSITGGLGFVVMFPPGYKSTQDGLDLGEVHIALGTNMRKADDKDDDEPGINLEGLANQIALTVPAAAAPGHFNLWTQRAAACSAEYPRLGVPAGEYQALFDEADRSGYRLEWIEGYTDKGQVKFNVVFRTNDPEREWASHHQMTAAQYQQKSDEYREQGLSRDHVDSYVVGNTVFYAAIWSRSDIDTHGYHGASAQAHQASFDSLTSKGWTPKVISGVSLGGQLAFTAVYTRQALGSCEARSFLTADEYQASFDENKRFGRHLHHLSSYEHEGQRRFSAIWVDKPDGVAGPAFHDMSEASLRTRWEDAVAAGWRTRAITACEVAGRVRYAAFWTREPAQGN